MAISNEEVEALLENSSDGNDAGAAVRPYDFTAQRINRTQLPLLEAINRSFADRAAVSLSGLLGRSATLQYDSMEAVKAADLQVSLPMPASIAVVRLKPLNGFAFISVEPALLLTLLDGFFGGTGRPNTDSQAAAAPAAQRFMALMLRSFAADVTAAWSPVAPLELELVKQETNPRLVQLGSPQESVIVAKFTVEFAARSGRIDWLLPEALLAPHREALSGETGAVPVRKQEAWAHSSIPARCLPKRRSVCASW
jgi:flagellar motor switch protein FliM